MRIFSSGVEAVKEVERDLYEMGIRTTTKSFQDKVTEEGFNTRELVGYQMMLTSLGERNVSEIFEALGYDNPVGCTDYSFAEAENRMGLIHYDPTKFREEVWSQFREDNGEFAYTYRGRIHGSPARGQNNQFTSLVRVHGWDNSSRQLVLSIYWPSVDNERRAGKRRVPCTVYYQVLDRGNEFYLIHNMRSCDLYTHFAIDMTVSYMFAMQLMETLQACRSDSLRAKSPKLIMTMGSLHAFEQDLKKRGIF